MVSQPEPIGIVTGRSTPQTFTFVSEEDKVPPRLEYVMIECARERVGDTIQQVSLLAQIANITADVMTLDEGIDFGEARTVLEQAGSFPPRVRAEASVLGFLFEGTVRQARNAVLPGTPVYAAPDELLRRFFSRDDPASITLGTLINRPGVEVKLDPNGLSRHLAIIAQTGAGKSYLAGKILEDLLALGATIIVLDPNSDYVQLRKLAPDAHVPYALARKTPHADRIQLYRVPGVVHRRYSEQLVGPAQSYTIRFADLDADAICDVAGVPSTAIRIRSVIEGACARLRRRRVDFSPRDLAQELAHFAGVPLDEAIAAHGARGPALPAGAAAEAPDGDDEAAATAFLRQLSAGEEETLSVAANGKRRGAGGTPTPEDEMRDARNALRYVKQLMHYPVWSHSTIDLEQLVQPMTLTVIDLAGTEKHVMTYTAEWLLTELWQRALAGELRWPVFVVLEEAHNLVPGGRDQATRASRIINTVAAEGRKFGVFLIVITQRPSKIADDTLSQCASQLIMRLTNPDDQKAVQRASEVISQALLDNLPGLNQGEAVVLGRLTRIPAMVKVSGRRGAEGGADINLIERFAQARQQVQAGRIMPPAGAARAGGRGAPHAPPAGGEPAAPARPSVKRVDLV